MQSSVRPPTRKALGSPMTFGGKCRATAKVEVLTCHPGNFCISKMAASIHYKSGRLQVASAKVSGGFVCRLYFGIAAGAVLQRNPPNGGFTGRFKDVRMICRSVIEIRTATVLDASEICAVLRRSISECCEADHKGDSNVAATWLKNKTAENVSLWVQEPGAIPLVAIVDGRVAGFALCSNGELALCYVIPEVLYRGVGKSLLRAIESQAVAHGITAISLDSTQT